MGRGVRCPFVPQLLVTFPREINHRVLSASVYRLVAEIELATAAEETWRVRYEILSETMVLVFLELAEGSSDEAARGLAMLKKWAET